MRIRVTEYTREELLVRREQILDHHKRCRADCGPGESVAAELAASLAGHRRRSIAERRSGRGRDNPNS